MTVTTTLSEQVFPGDGSNKNFPFNIKFFDNAQIYVYLVGPGGVTVLKTLNVDYTISGAGQSGGGIVTMAVAPPVNYKIKIKRIISQTQPTSIRNQGAFFPAIHEDVFDRLTMLIQQAIGAASNSLQKSDSGLYWDFLGLPGKNLGAPMDSNDAVPKSYLESYVSGILATGQGPANNAANVLYATSGGITRTVQSRLRDIVMITDFTGAVEGATNSSAAAFAAAEASTATNIFLPYGIWNAGTTPLTKRYYGLGKLITSGSYRGQQYSNIQTDPQRPINPDFEFAATGDISHVNVSRYNLGRIRNNLDEYYFNSTTTPVWEDMVSQAGHSGTSAKFVGVLAIGTTVLNLVGPAPEILPGMPIRITNDIQGFNATCVTNSGNILEFTPGSPYPFTNPFTNSPIPTYGYVTRAIRTMNTLHMGNVEHQGGGDAYVWCGRIINNNKFAQPAQNHFFETSTIGLIGGDLVNITAGGFITGSEINITDSNFSGSYQTAGWGHLVNLQRTADTGQFGCSWMGFVTKSEASAYADVAYKAYGKFKRGLDFVGMSFDGDRAAITIPRTSRIYLDAQGLVKDTRGFNWWSDAPGGSWIGTGALGDVVIAQGGLGRLFFEDASTRIRAKTATDHVILDRGYLDLFTEVTPTAGTSQGYATICINGVFRKIQIYAMP